MWTREGALTCPRSPEELSLGRQLSDLLPRPEFCHVYATYSTEPIYTEQPTVCQEVSDAQHMDDWNKVAVFTAFSWNKEKVGFSMNPRIQTSLGIHGDTISAWWEWWGWWQFWGCIWDRPCLCARVSVLTASHEGRGEGGTEGGGAFLNGNSSMYFCLQELSVLLFQWVMVEPSPGSCQTLGVGAQGCDMAGVLSFVRKHELMPRFPQVTKIALALWRQAWPSGRLLVIELSGLR